MRQLEWFHVKPMRAKGGHKKRGEARRGREVSRASEGINVGPTGWLGQTHTSTQSFVSGLLC